MRKSFIDSKTKLCAVIGNPVEQSLSPLIHNVAIAHYKINAVFLAFKPKSVQSAIEAMRALDIRELSVTIAFKEAVIPFLDEIEYEAKSIGNVNTIINRKGRLKGYNTDIDGIEQSLKGTRVENQEVLLIGAGGAAKTIAYVIHKYKGQLHIVNRDSVEASNLARKYGASWHELKDIRKVIKVVKPKIIINSTPVGMGRMRGKSLVPRVLLQKGMTIFDVIYNPLKTKLICDAEASFCKIITGDRMFLGQAARQFELLSKKRAPLKIMERHLYEHLRKKL
jgi:shikimate dehydrogenase